MALSCKGVALVTENIFEKEFSKETIFIDRNMLSPHFTPEELPFRETQIKEISQALAVSLKKQKPDNIFIYGKTGTGKTTVTQKGLKQLIDFAISKGLQITGP